MGSTPAVAQVGDAKVTQFVPDGELKKAEEGKTHWNRSLGLNINLSLAQNSKVVGQVDGASVLVGAGIVGSLEYLNGPHELRNTLGLVESFARTPVIDEFVKTNDTLRFESLYAYNFIDWAGAFGRFTFDAPLLNTTDVRTPDTVFTIDRLEGPDETRASTRPDAETIRVKLSDAFAPLTLTESLGLVLKPLDAEPAIITVRLGGGARETFAEGVLVNADDKNTPVIELKEVDDVFQGGVEGAIGVQGKFPAQRLTYGIDFGVLIPFINNDPLDRSGIDLTRIGLSAQLLFSMWEWLGLTYQLKVLSDPQLVSDTQIANLVLLTFKYDIVEATKEDVAPPADPAVVKAQEEAAAAAASAKAAEERAKAAEERAKAAEDRIRSLEGAPPPAPPPPAPPPPSPNPQ